MTNKKSLAAQIKECSGTWKGRSAIVDPIMRKQFDADLSLAQPLDVGAAASCYIIFEGVDMAEKRAGLRNTFQNVRFSPPIRPSQNRVVPSLTFSSLRRSFPGIRRGHDRERSLCSDIVAHHVRRSQRRR